MNCKITLQSLHQSGSFWFKLVHTSNTLIHTLQTRNKESGAIQYVSIFLCKGLDFPVK